MRLFAHGDGGGSGLFLQAVFEALEDTARVIRGLAEGIEDAVAHVEGGLESGLFTTVLPVGKVLGELVPLAADAQTPSLEGGGLVRVSGYVALCHSNWCRKV